MDFTGPFLNGDAESLVRGTHGDPFRLLGPHRLPDRPDGVAIRAFLPAATEVVLLVRFPAAAEVPMRRRHSEGLFEAEVSCPPDAMPDYRLRITWRDGTRLERDDPYRFGRLLSEYDVHLFAEGTLRAAYDRLGAHPRRVGDTDGVHFAVWAPNAQRVSIVGDFNAWDGRAHPMRNLVPSGIWELFVPGLGVGERYKFEVRTSQGHLLQKADPYARQFEVPPLSASIVTGASLYEWQDHDWMAARRENGALFDRPMSIYEVHLGSWRRVPEDGFRPLTYRELAEQLVPYVAAQGFTHLELLPVLEHPFAGSWGYQVTGFFAPTSRHGTPDDFKFFVDACHRAGLGVLLDWVPGHFPKDSHGLARFDGTALYEHEDPRQGEHQDWGTLIFNYGRNEVRNFLITSALFWLGEFHLDGLRVDAVASMLYLDYSRREGQWVPNKYGGRENIEAVEFIRQLNAVTHHEYPGTITVAEESTAWPGVSRPVHLGGLGFTYKWNMGWMHDILQYTSRDPIYRRWGHTEITFSMLYAYTENFILPFSHDEVVHGKRSMLDKMPGDVWQKCANLRALYSFMYGHPGKKLLFMGCEFGQWLEWNHDSSLDWHLLDEGPWHAGIKQCVRDLNALYRREPALHQRDFDPSGFQWIDCNDHENSVISFVRRAADPEDFLVFVLNFTPVPRPGYRVGVPRGGVYAEVHNSDSHFYGGSGVGNPPTPSEPVPAHGHDHSIVLTLPPLGCVALKAG